MHLTPAELKQLLEKIHQDYAKGAFSPVLFSLLKMTLRDRITRLRNRD